MDDGWHVNANPASFDFLIPTTLRASLRNGDPFPEPIYPAGKTLQTPLGPLAVYEHAAEVRSSLPPGLSKDGTTETINLVLQAQACNEAGICLPPETLKARISF